MGPLKSGCKGNSFPEIRKIFFAGSNFLERMWFGFNNSSAGGNTLSSTTLCCSDYPTIGRMKING
jgi:hypothetical protein